MIWSKSCLIHWPLYNFLFNCSLGVSRTASFRSEKRETEEKQNVFGPDWKPMKGFHAKIFWAPHCCSVQASFQDQWRNWFEMCRKNESKMQGCTLKWGLCDERDLQGNAGAKILQKYFNFFVDFCVFESHGESYKIKICNNKKYL